MRRLVVAIAGLLAMAVAAIPAEVADAATIQVPCSVPALVEVINQANTAGNADTLSLASGCTYTLVAADNAANGLPVIASDITINGNGSTITRSPSAPSFRILDVGSSGTLTLNQLTISGGLANADCPNPFPSICGGGIASRGTVTMNTSRLIDNTATGSVAGFGPLGGGVASAPGAALILTYTEVSGNTVSNTGSGSANGGGIGSNGALTITNSRVINNTLRTTNCVGFCGFGAGITSFGPATLRTSIVAGNSASTPGGVLRAAGVVSGATMTMTGTLIANNTASAPGGLITGSGISTGAALSVTRSAVRGNTATALGGTAEGAAISVGPIGNVTINDSAVQGNTASAPGGTALGGGLSNAGGGTVTMTQTVVSGNTASAPGGTARGGGLFNAIGSTTLTSSAVTGNIAGDGGGIFEASGNVTLSNSTVGGNTPNNCSPPGSVPGCTG